MRDQFLSSWIDLSDRIPSGKAGLYLLIAIISTLFLIYIKRYLDKTLSANSPSGLHVSPPVPLFDKSGEGMIITENGWIISHNSAAAKLLCCKSSTDIDGRHILEFSPKNQSEDTPSEHGFEKIFRSIRENGCVRFKWIFRKQDDTELQTEILATEIAHNGSPVQLLNIRAIEEFIRTEHSFKPAIEDIEKANKAKSEFLATMSHEIRTPLTGIIGISEILHESGGSSEQKKLLSMLDSESSALLSIINDILDYSKIEAGKMILECIDFNFRIMIEDIAHIYTLRAAQKNLEFNLHIDERIPVHLNGDPGKLRQILVNILENALKFTHAGTLALSVQLKESKEDQFFILFDVTDTGIGMFEDHLKRMFQPYEQGKGDTSYRYGGTGLGMAISKTLTEMMNGHIDVASSPGKGTTVRFTVSLLASVSRPVIPAIKKEIDGTKILLVKDPQESMARIRVLMEGYHCLIDETEDISTAESMMYKASDLSAPYDLVIITLSEDALCLAAHIKQSNILQKTPILAVTSVGHRGDARLCMDKGIDGYLPKPLDPQGLKRAVESLLALKTIDPGTAIKSLVTRYSIRDDIKTGFKILLAEDYPTNQRLILHHLLSEGYHTELAENGIQAVKMFKEKSFNLILMDIRLPELDGIEATRQIRRHERNISGTGFQRIPIVALTANSSKEEIDASITAGMDHFITKPLKRNQLIEIVDRIAILNWKNKEGIQTGEGLEDIFPSPKPFKKILLVEDTPINQKIITQHIHSIGHTVDVAENGQQAIEYFKKTPYDLIFMDIQMPVMDGITATLTIREFEKQTNTQRNVPIIAITANKSELNLETCLAAGMNDFEAKPIKRKRILDLIDIWTLNQSDIPPTPPHRIEENTIDYNGALAEFQHDKPLLDTILKRFLSDVGQQITILSQALEKEQSDIIADTAHSIKGGASNILATDLSNAAEKLEQIGKSGDLVKAGEAISQLNDAYRRLSTFTDTATESAIA